MIRWLRQIRTAPGRLQMLENWSLDVDELTQNLKRRVEELEHETRRLGFFTNLLEGKTNITTPIPSKRK